MNTELRLDFHRSREKAINICPPLHNLKKKEITATLETWIHYFCCNYTISQKAFPGLHDIGRS